MRLPIATFQSPRHHAASASLAGGTDLAIVSKAAGHASIAVTASFYSHMVGGIDRRAADATSAAVGWRFDAASPHLLHIARGSAPASGAAHDAAEA